MTVNRRRRCFERLEASVIAQLVDQLAEELCFSSIHDWLVVFRDLRGINSYLGDLGSKEKAEK
jgi:hypothetical protein